MISRERAKNSILSYSIEKLRTVTIERKLIGFRKEVDWTSFSRMV